MTELHLLDVIRLLLPDFGALVRGEMAGINALFVVAVVGVLVGFCFYVTRERRDAEIRVDSIATALSDVPAGALPDRVKVLDKEIAGSDMTGKRESRARSEAAHLWKEFAETLVHSRSGDEVFNSVDAAYFFNTESLAANLVHSRLLSLIPSLLTALGVLGTFVGLTVGLNGVEISSDSTVDAIKSNVNTLISGAGVAFMTSVWGVALSLIANFVEKIAEQKVSERVTKLQEQIDGALRHRSSEELLAYIADVESDSREQLGSLHEKIGDSLQRAIETLSADMQKSVADAITGSIAPALDRLVEATSNQNGEALERLVERFGDGFTQYGTEQARRLDEATSGMREAMESMSAKIGGVMDAVQAQAAAQQSATQAQSAEFQAQVTALIATSEQQAHHHAEASRAQVEALRTQLAELSAAAQRQVTEQASQHAQQAEQVRAQMLEMSQAARSESAARAEKDREQTEQFRASLADLMSVTDRHAAVLTAVVDGLEIAAGRMGTSTAALDTAAHSLQETSTAYTTSAQAFRAVVDRSTAALEQIGTSQRESANLLADSSTKLGDLSRILVAAGEDLQEAAHLASTSYGELDTRQKEFLNGLQGQVEAFSRAVAQWLESYGQQVRDQTTERLREWNEQTSGFSSEMLRVTSAMSDIVTQMEERTERAAVSA